MGFWNGYKYSLLTDAERRAFREMHADIMRRKWHAKYITKAGLKKERRWTDAMIKRFLKPVENCGVPQVHAYLRTRVLAAEKKPEVQAWLAKRTADRVVPIKTEHPAQ